MKTILSRAIFLMALLLQTAPMLAQTSDLSGYWKNDAGIGANWVQLRDEVWFISITRDWKAYFEGKLLDSRKIEGRLVKINLHTGQRLEVRLEMAHLSKEKIAMLTPLSTDSSYTSTKELHYVGYFTAYDSIPNAVFDEKYRAWEVKSWFQDGDTIATLFIDKGEPVFDKGVFINGDSLQLIRQLKQSAYPCHTQEVLHCKLEKNGWISVRARRVGGTCGTSMDYAWKGTTNLRYTANGGYPPGNVLINAREVPVPASILQLNIPEIRVDGQPAGFDALSIHHKPFRITERQEIFFQFSTAVPGMPLYYQLRPYDVAWHSGFPEHKARYFHLPEGNYTFRVTTNPERSELAINTLEFSFRVRRPFYRQTWFYVLLVSGMALLTAWSFRWREQQRHKLEQLRQRIARELHDDIGSTLSSISMLTTAAKKRVQDPAFGIPLDSIGNKAREALDNIGDILWTMRNEDISGEDLLLRMKTFAVEILETRGADVHFQATEEAANLLLLAEQRKELYLLFKEAINNAAKYSQASEVTIMLHAQNDRIRLHIEDNGRGFDPASATSGNGLNNMQRRAERLGGKLFIESAPGAGTRIVLEA